MLSSKLMTLSALSALSYYSHPLLSSAHSLGGLVVSNKSFVPRTCKRLKSLKSRSNRRKAKRRLHV